MRWMPGDAPAWETSIQTGPNFEQVNSFITTFTQKFLLDRPRCMASSLHLSGTTYAYLAKSYSSLTTRHGALRTCHKAISVTQRDRGPEYARTCYMCCISQPQLKNQLSGLKGQTGDGPRSRNQGGLPQEPDTITSCMRFPQATDHSITSMQCKLVRTLDRHGT